MVKSIAMRRRKPEELSLNLTPLIDIVFLLLIFFMVTTTFKQSDQLGVELPETLSPNAHQQIKGVQLGITAKGEYVLQGESIGSSLTVLESKLKELVVDSKAKGQPLMLMGDKMAPHQSVVTAMDAARRLGMTRIKIVTEHLEN